MKQMFIQKRASKSGGTEDMKGQILKTLQQMNLDGIKEKIKNKELSFNQLLEMDEVQLKEYLGPENSQKAPELWKAIHMHENARNIIEQMFKDLTINDEY